MQLVSDLYCGLLLYLLAMPDVSSAILRDSASFGVIFGDDRGAGWSAQRPRLGGISGGPAR